MSMTMVPRSVMKNVGKEREREKREKRAGESSYTFYTKW